MRTEVNLQMKKLLSGVAWLAAFWVLIGSAHSQEDMHIVNAVAFKNSKRPPAVFRHDDHNEAAGIEACNQCHHVYDEGGKWVEDESSEDTSCADCHGFEAEGRKPGLMKAFHKTCKGCHQEKHKGPVMCGQCHVRKPASSD